MTFRQATIAGAGLAGLNAAVTLVEAGLTVTLSDAAAREGGRCRAYHDPSLGLTIDNGNHIALSGNTEVRRFLDRTDGDWAGAFVDPGEAAYAFADLADGDRWTVRINDGPLPWWIAVPSRRVPGTRIRDYLPLARLLGRREGRVGDRIATRGSLWHRLLDPVLLATLNTTPADGSAALTAEVLRETIAKGGRRMIPRVAAHDLDTALIAPARDWLAVRHVATRTRRRLRALSFEGDRVASLDWGDGPEPVAADAAVVLAVPAWVAADLVPGLTVPDEHRAIVSATFRLPPPAGAPTMLGLIGGTVEWVFAYPDRIGTTVSAADALVGEDRASLARRFWADVQAGYGITAPMPSWQVVKEKRATFAATPEQNAKRPSTRTRWRNLFLAGDWTRTGLPATIEGALRSGATAADAALGRHRS